MRLTFLNRSREMGRLLRAVGAEHGSFCCVYGRRRCGKSRLLQEVLPRDRSAYFAADEREPPLQRAALASAMAERVPGMDQVTYPDWASLLERWWREAPSGSVLVLDEFPYLVATSPEIPSLLQRLLDREQPRAVHLIICGSSQRMMQGLVLDASAPLYGRAREILDIVPLSWYWLGGALGITRPVDVLEAYSMWGGIPRYWELAAEGPSLWESVEELVLDPMGVLHNEPQRLLMDDLRDTAQAASILALVGTGCTRVSEIAGRMGKPATSLTRPTQRLLDMGLLRRDVPFGSPERGGKRTAYAIADPFLAFWFRYVEPNRSRLQSGMVAEVGAAVRRDFAGHAAAVWEALVRETFPRLHLDEREWLPASRWWGPGVDRRPLEVDVVAESVDGRALLVGEVKLRITVEDARHVQRVLDEKVSRLPFAQSYERVTTALFPADAGDAEGLPGVVAPGDVLLATR